MSEITHPAPVNALVVDDSAVARKVLTSLLRREGLEVDTAVSAEDALKFLASHTPDVIFLDHTMPGMNGLDALKAIKTNPRTATIPVMMFTSQSGEVYLSQARALGAIDVLQKDSLADTDLSGRLREQGILKKTAPRQNGTASASGSNQNSPGQLQLASLIRLQVREELTRLKEDLPILLEKYAGASNTKVTADLDTPLNGEKEFIHQPENTGNLARIAAWSLLGLAAVLLLGWLLLRPTNQSVPPGSTIELTAEQPINTANVPVDATAGNLATADTAIPETSKLLEIITWSIGDHFVYAANETALSGSRFNRIQTLLTMLADAGFKGQLEITVHQGQFCVTTNNTGVLSLAAPKTLAERCNLLTPNPDPAGAGLVSLPFSNFMQNSPVANGEQGISIVVQSGENQPPLAPYPDRYNGTLAEQWNRAAQQNNRITLKLIAE